MVERGGGLGFAQELGASTPNRPSGAIVRVSSRSGAWVDAPTMPLPTFAPSRWPMRRVALYAVLAVALAATTWVFADSWTA